MSYHDDAADDPKVRYKYKVGEGGAPSEASEQLSALHKENKRAGDAMRDIG
jgi:hypothetical protein